MSTGITALLYGAPGTGKTESVYQLAKKYNRPIFKVEISETKSMWFGESQKLVKKIFTDYYTFKKTQKVCPILLFNEADAIIGKRKSAGSSSVSDTENAIQNVLLEELENFDGILFATSNLVANLDSAFERRFLFKVKFENPSMVNAAKIWRNKLPLLSAKEALQLASQFSYSGGEMENIARKSLMDEIVFGTKPDFERIISFCENEKWSGGINGTRIGF
jgi:SpoVK/Ycf46/Vps4 family AAA+-type ATPase